MYVRPAGPACHTVRQVRMGQNSEYIFTHSCVNGAIYNKYLREKLKSRENFDTELQQNQRALQFLKIMIGCR